MTDIVLDDVRLMIGQTEIRPKSYEIQRDVFTQPCAFSFTMGDAITAAELQEMAPPNSEFHLYVNETLVFTGLTDGFNGQSANAEGTALTIRGRDMMAPLISASILAETTFTDITYADLTEKAIRAVLGTKPFALVYTNDANRKAVTAARAPTSNRSAVIRGGSTTVVDAVTGEIIEQSSLPDQPGPPPAPPPPPARTIKVEIGSQWYPSVLRPEYDRAGFILMATADGNYFLGAPDTSQVPSGRLARYTTIDGGSTNILGHRFSNEATSRHSSYEVHFREGGGKKSRKSANGRVEDPEMKAWGIDRPWVGKDDKTKTAAQAEQYAKRKMCDERRAGFNLLYMVQGHSTTGPSGEEVLWAPETVVDVDDEELNIHERMYVESVRMTGFPSRTELKVCRISDILGATPEEGFVSA